MKHKHAEVIKAWADGQEIEAFDHHIKKWFVVKHPIWESEMEYRVKPTPKPDVVLYVGFESASLIGYLASYEEVISKIDVYMTSRLISHWTNKLQITIDGETGKLKAAEVIE
jgi:hypothetical protein